MRLLSREQGGGFALTTFSANNIPPYAILSHTWTEGEEITYKELVTGEGLDKAGYGKLIFCAERAERDGLQYFWVDSCCIDKQDGNELSAALNNMFRWYQRAVKCYVHLSDVRIADEVTNAQRFRVTWEHAFRRSRWFRRGWTLQELLAPACVEFFSANKKYLGSKLSLELEIHEITQIPIRALRRYDLREFSVEERMGWVAGRETTVEEDRAYCLLGIFGVFLPLIPGEGEEHALRRLRKEIQGQAELSDGSPAKRSNKTLVSMNLPFPRNEFFVGRESLLEILEDRLCPSEPHRRISLYGLGGGGKTAVALEFGYRMLAKHSQFLVLWVPAISRETFEIAYLEIGNLLGIPGIMDNNADVKQLVKDGLDSGDYGDWLMIIDNADDSSILLESGDSWPQSSSLYDYIPRSDQGAILFTTRSRKAAERLTQSNILELEDMTLVDMKQLMSQRIPKKNLLDDDRSINELLELLTRLPLAIIQAVAFINSNQISIAEYVSLFKQADTEMELLSERFDDLNRYRGIENTIAKTWRISFDQILKQDRLAADCLSFMACIDRVNIPLSLLPVGSPMRQIKALGTLTGYAFISERQRDAQQPEEERFFNMHRLVQKATIWWLKETNKWTSWTEQVYWRLEKLIPLGDLEGRATWIGYIPHGMHVSGLTNDLDDLKRASLLSRIGRCQYELGQYALAATTHERALTIRREHIGDEHILTLASMNNVALALCEQGKYKEAEIMQEQTLHLQKRVLGAEHPDTLTSMSNLAFMLYRQDKYQEAETMHRQTLGISKRVLGVDHKGTLKSMGNLAVSLDRQGKFEEAEVIHRQTLESRRRVLGPEHSDTLRTLNNLAYVLDAQGKSTEAEKIYRQTLDLRKKLLGEEHPETLVTKNNLAFMINRQGKVKEAEMMHRQTLDLREKVLGAYHRETLDSVHSLARSLARQRRYTEANGLYQRACEGRTTVLGPRHPDTVVCCNEYSDMLEAQKLGR